MARYDIEFLSEGTILRGWFYEPDPQGAGTATHPAIVMAHGFSAVKEQYLDRYAEVFAASGFAVLVYDHRGFGASDGHPRQEVDPVLQRRGYRDAISYLLTRPDVDAARIGIWGTSYSGGHVLEVAAIDRRVKCVVSQVPTISGYQSALRRTRSDLVPALLERFDEDRAHRFAGGTPAMLPAVSDDPQVACAMAGADAFRFFTESAARFAPNWKNEVTLRSAEMARENEPGQYVARISPAPLLMIVADQDWLTPTDLCLQAWQAALEPKQLLMINGGHFTPYVEHFEATSRAAAQWFERHLSGARQPDHARVR
ncbi:alpha/beta hydrolase [Burkholderia stagnalis]|uniref:alpha/beta hydrolase n=1 Tax=Burkholderia stagnalis TaxID=1503054 RepID=UPI0007566EC2|nr:alpha/beta hydrolase [Burkholderia stagnalis]KVC61222.1 acetylxylan esterase [Burkholderia stagnalis]KVN20145.1 acetylxylan esterase [Burkholderia stagnalis]KWI71461.1 acetylxylan esterase [Burkholderia stagnalis]KWK72500.1 acetylxylan esterase [Burkholderia stagnalis]KWN10357.1 acetylxylan esterase [Burkholderia stagnalis]